MMPSKIIDMTIPRILIIDDQPESIALLVEFLSEKQLDIQIALGGKEGVGKAVNGQPDLILLDILMPEMDGLITCRQLKTNTATADIPVIFLSASGDIDNKLTGFDCGAVDYITKPFSQEEVYARLNLHLRHKQQLDQLGTRLAHFLVPSDEVPSSRDEELFQRAMACLKDNLSSAPTLADVTSLIGTNPNKINHIFRARTGMTLAEYLQDWRLESSRHLLANSDTQIQLIANSVGYCNAGDFTRAFRTRYGITPRQYRKAAKDNSC